MANIKYNNIDWFGDIPTEWNVNQIGNYYELRNEKVNDYDFAPLSVTMKGVVPQLATAAKSNDHSNRKLVKKGDFVINSRSDRRGSCGISPLDGSVSLINTVMEPRGEMNPQYYNWLFHTEQFADEFYKWGHGIVDDLWTTRWQEMKKILIVAPELDEQQAIADYLDEKCTKIDEIIAAAKTSIEEYKDLKQSVIFEAVTKGLDKNIKMKKTGEKWLPIIPNHWKMEKGKNLFFETNFRSIDGQEELLTVSQYTGITPRSKKNVTMFQSESLVDYKICEVGDIAANTMWMWAGAVGVSKYHGVISPSYNTYRQKYSDYDNDYLDYMLRIAPLVDEYASLSTGIRASRLRLYPKQFLNIIFPVPPLNEQKEIVAYLDEKCKQSDSLISEKQSLIQDLESYKKSLIYEVVTGKRRVV